MLGINQRLSQVSTRRYGFQLIGIAPPSRRCGCFVAGGVTAPLRCTKLTRRAWTKIVDAPDLRLRPRHANQAFCPQIPVRSRPDRLPLVRFAPISEAS